MASYLRISGIILMAVGFICSMFFPFIFPVEHTYGTGPGALTTIGPNLTLMGLGIVIIIIGLVLFFLLGARGGKIYK